MIIYVLYYLIYWGINAYICIYFLQMPKYLMLASSVAALLASGAAGLDESHLALKKSISWKSLQICYLFETQSCSIRKSQLDPFL
jgi:hypothetical protein